MRPTAERLFEDRVDPEDSAVPIAVVLSHPGWRWQVVDFLGFRVPRSMYCNKVPTSSSLSIEMNRSLAWLAVLLDSVSQTSNQQIGFSWAKPLR